PRQRNSLDDFTLHRLKYSSLELFGRDQEVALLKKALDRLSGGDVDRSLVLVKGYSGVGKTALVDSLRNMDFTPTTRSQSNDSSDSIALDGLFARGKFDLQLRQEPYSALIEACTEICETLELMEWLDEVRETLTSELQSELPVLINVIPTIKELLRQEDIDQLMVETSQLSMESQGPAEAKNRLRFAFQRFIRIVTQFFRPLILVLDDMQWADAASLELLEALVSDRDCAGLLMVVIYRSNAVTEGDKLSTSMSNIEKIGNDADSGLELTQIALENLELADINTSDEERIHLLAEVCYRKTHGNIFFLLQYLSILCENELLEFNFGTLQWDWNEAEIEAKTTACDNVVDMLKEKMKLLSQDHILVLQLAGSLGASFAKRSLRAVWSNLKLEDSGSDTDTTFSEDGQHVEDALSFFESEGYIEQVGKRESGSETDFEWIHDAIQEAALALIPEEHRPHFNFRVGEILLSHYNDEELLSAIFEVVNLLNQGDKPLEMFQRKRFAELNCKACKKSMSLSAFDSAAQYAATGIALLGDNPWGEHTDLALELYTYAAEAEGDLGRFEVMEGYCKEVFGADSIPVKDKLPIYIAWFDSINARGESRKAGELAVELLKGFDCRFPSTRIGMTWKTISNVVKVKHSVDTIHPQLLSVMEEPVKLNLMKLLDRLSEYCYVAECPLTPLVIFKSLRWTLKFGYCDRSPPALATTAMMLTAVANDLQAGRHFANKAVELQELSKCRQTACKTFLCCFGLVLPWTTEFTCVVKPLFRAYETGMQVGDIDNACWSIWHALDIRFLAGGSTLESLEIDFRKYSAQMIDLKRINTFRIAKAMNQLCLCLMGRPGNHRLELVGQVISEAENAELKEDKFAHHNMHALEGLLLCLMGHYVAYADRVLALGQPTLEKAHLCGPNIMLDNLAIGLSCLAAARATGKRRYKVMGNKIRWKIKKWVQMGNPNVRFAEALLDAEWEALLGRKFLAVKNYEIAVHLAARKGMFHEACLASERLGLYHLEVMNDKDEAAFRLKEASKYAHEWGADAKVLDLRNKYEPLWSSMESSTA
ncbi:MAG: hypothetical protein SGILL_004900, partial [Bacillariaceae sp.]